MSDEFDDWFENSGYDEQYRSQFLIVWKAAIKAASDHVYNCEGTDFGLIDET